MWGEVSLLQSLLAASWHRGQKGSSSPFRNSYQYNGITIDSFLNVITFQLLHWVQSSQIPAFGGCRQTRVCTTRSRWKQINVRWLGIKCNMLKDRGGLFYLWDSTLGSTCPHVQPQYSLSSLGKTGQASSHSKPRLLSKLVCWAKVEVQHWVLMLPW